MGMSIALGMQRVVTIVSALAAGTAFGQTETKTLVELAGSGAIRADAVESQGVAVQIADGSLRAVVADGVKTPGFRIMLDPASQNWSGFQRLLVDVRNTGSKDLVFVCRAENPKSNGWRYCMERTVHLSPGQQGVFELPLAACGPSVDAGIELENMKSGPNWPQGKLDAAHVKSLYFYFGKPFDRSEVAVSNIRLDGVYRDGVVLSKEDFFPFVDIYGQYIHDNWPGKVQSVEDLKAQAKAEAEDLASHPGPDHWDQYGGWQAGPQIEPTGFFRTGKYHDKWWLVDPDGRLFWSHGIDTIRTRNITRVSGREHYFKDLPAPDDPFAQFYIDRAQELGKPWVEYDYTAANLYRMYGDSWEAVATEMIPRRLRSWGMNTYGSFSLPELYLNQKTPYTVMIFYTAPQLDTKFPDVFDPQFVEALRARLAAEKDTTVNDPYCIGYFVDNELQWGKWMDDDVFLGNAAFALPAGRAAKKELVNDLQQRYKTIGALNKKWKSDYGSWDEVLQATSAPGGAKPDLSQFARRMTDIYFETVSREVKALSPNHLYLGCRFNSYTHNAVRIASRHCDVVSFNVYRFSPNEISLPMDMQDRPLLISEFHFGAQDRGVFDPGLVAVNNQEARAAAYRGYLDDALRNPRIVGTHWFQYRDEPTTARNDGENAQIGFASITDGPYPETIQASRDVGNSMYQRRLGE